MLQTELKAQRADFKDAKQELLGKMAEWNPRLHGNRDYLLCLAGAGTQLQFFAVRNGGSHSKAVSRRFSMANALDRLQVSCKLCCCGGVSSVLHMLL